MKTISKKQLRTVTVLVRYFIKATQAVVLYVENDKGARYYVRLETNGVNTCNCKATKECYHIKAAIDFEQERWLAYRRELAVKLSKQYMTVEIVEQVVESLVAPKVVSKPAQDVVSPKVTDISTKGNFGSKPFSILKTA